MNVVFDKRKYLILPYYLTWQNSSQAALKYATSSTYTKWESINQNMFNREPFFP